MTVGSLASDEIVLPFVGQIGQYRFGTTIESTAYLFDVRWNTLDAAWYFDVLEADETPIATGLKIVLGVFIGRTSTHELFSDGAFLAFDQSGAERDATYDDLGTRVVVKYLTRLELSRRLHLAATALDVPMPLDDR